MEPKRVIFITIDALRRDHLRSYGYKRNIAPNLEKFIKKGTVFEKAIANGPETPSSFSAIFTSILPYLNGGFSPLPPQKIMFTQILEENKIFNYGIHSNPNLGKFYNYNRGFNIFLDGERYKKTSNKEKKQTLKGLFFEYIKKVVSYRNILEKLMFKLRGFNRMKSWLRKFTFLTDLLLPFTPIAYNAPYIATKVSNFLKSYNGSFFLWAHFMDVHNPFNPPIKNLLKFTDYKIDIAEIEFLNQVYRNPDEYNITDDLISKIKLLYDGEINYVDEYLEKILEIIKEKYKKNCLIIITADHGESFYEHGFFFHSGNIFEELLRVPLFLIEIGRSQIKKYNEQVQLLDLAPTILDYFGIKIPDYYQGKSLLPVLKGDSIERNGFIISETYKEDRKMKRNKKEGYILLSIRKDNWKYIYDQEKNEEYLFNLNRDPMEGSNLINENINKAENFRLIKNYHLRKSFETDEKTKLIAGIKKLEEYS